MIHRDLSDEVQVSRTLARTVVRYEAGTRVVLPLDDVISQPKCTVELSRLSVFTDRKRQRAAPTLKFSSPPTQDASEAIFQKTETNTPAVYLSRIYISFPAGSQHPTHARSVYQCGSQLRVSTLSRDRAIFPAHAAVASLEWAGRSTHRFLSMPEYSS